MTEFRTKLNNLVTYVRVKGTLVTVKFSARTKSDAYGLYSTNNNAVVAALKKHPDFGKGFELVASATKAPAAKAQAKPKAIYEDVKNTQQAQKVLAEQYGVNPDSVATKEDAKRFAKELNISFPNL